MERVIITKPMIGICGMQVCAVKDATDDEIIKVCNEQNESGTTAGWCTVIRSGDGEPVQCEQEKERNHYIVMC